MQNFITGLATQEPRFQKLNSEGDLLLTASNDEEEPILREKLEHLKHQLVKLSDTVNHRQANLVEALLLSQQYSYTLKEAKSRLLRTEDLLQKIDADKSKVIDVQKERIKGLQDNVDQLYPLMTTLKETGFDLIELSGPGNGSDNIRAQVAECEKRWENLTNRVQEKGDYL